MRHIIFVCVLVLLASCQFQQAQDFKETRFLLGTIVEFTVYAEDEARALQAIAQATLVMQAIENDFTISGDKSNTVKLFNQSQHGADITLKQNVALLLAQSLDIHKQTQGAFDPTLGDLNQRWGFSAKEPSQEPLASSEIKQGLAVSGAQYLQAIKPQVWRKKKAALKLDFGAIAKGLAIDKGIEALAKMGVKHAIINAGGDMRILGDHGDKPWKVAVRHPRQEVPLGWFEVSSNISIVTSGDYERFYIYNGKRYHHIIDPQTGEPSSASMSVTVSAPTAAQADALSTAMFILGPKKGLPIIEEIPEVEAVWVDQMQVIHQSSGMKAWFHVSGMKVP